MARVVRVLASNPGPFTLEGTNTWLVGWAPCLVIDPGPDDAAHVEEVRREAGPVAAILLSHRHPDHAPGAAVLAARTGAPVMAFRPEPGEQPLAHGQVVRAGAVALVVLHTPGHTSDHVVFHDPGSTALFTGDAVLGRGTSVIDPPEGDLAAYLRSLEVMRGLQPGPIYPGHGPAVWDGSAKLDEYLEHRRLREQQVLDGLRAGARTPQELVPAIYADYPEGLHPIAARSVLAHLLKLESEGRVVRAGRPSGDRFGLTRPGPVTTGDPTDPGR